MVPPLPIPLSLLPVLMAMQPAQQAASVRAPQAPRAQVRIQQHIVVRVPRASVARMPIATGAPLPPIGWVERRTDQCVAVATLAGAAITRPDSVDLVLAGGKRVRARLGADCPALGFYRGFYVRPSSDGRLCARRDTIRSRSGGECRIEGLRALVPSR